MSGIDAIIAKALTDDANAESEHGIQFTPEHFASAAAAVRDALLAEGTVESLDRQTGMLYRTNSHGRNRVLVIPLASEPVVSPRPNQHQETP